tara:strand:- start:274 stop:588 length:315 start_codon:yes stop_codon:yes gene_type:complete
MRFTELVDNCKYGRYYCTTDKKYKCRKSPKRSRDYYEMGENFADGRKPGDKGSLKQIVTRMFGPGDVTVSKAKRILSSKKASKRAKQLAHWFINMNKGRKKKKK